MLYATHYKYHYPPLLNLAIYSNPISPLSIIFPVTLLLSLSILYLRNVVLSVQSMYIIIIKDIEIDDIYTLCNYHQQ